MVDTPRAVKLLAEAWARARQDALDAGQSVVEVHQGWLVETFPNGTRRKIRELTPCGNIPAGTKITVKKIGLE